MFQHLLLNQYRLTFALTRTFFKMYLAVWILLITTIIYLWYWLQKRKYKDVIEKIRGPPPKFFFGNALEFGSNTVDIFQNTQRLIKTYGSLVRIWQGPFRLQLFVTDPDHVEFFLSSNVHIKKSEGYKLMRPLTGMGLVNSTGERWRKHRKILTPGFHFKILEQFFDHFNSCGKILIDKLKRKVGQKFDIYTFLNLYALDVLCESTLKIEANAQENSDHVLIRATSGYFSIFFKRLFSLLKQNDLIFRFTSDYQEGQKYLSVLHGFTEKVIQNRKKERSAETDTSSDEYGIKKKKAFLDILLDSNTLSDEEIREEIDTIFAAGHDTIATAVSFGLFELAKYRDVQNKILAEVHEIIGSDKDVDITFKHVQEMKYLDGVMKEILRLYPPVPFFERELVEDVVLDGITIPKGATVSFHPYSHHRNEKLFPDPESFKPERFLLEDVEKRHPFAFIPFSAGPRNCIGFKYALLNCKTAIANVIRNFELSPVVPAHEPLLANATVMKSINGLPLVLKLRE